MYINPFSLISDEMYRKNQAEVNVCVCITSLLREKEEKMKSENRFPFFLHSLFFLLQFRVESMMLRTAKPLNYIPLSPSVHQRAK